MFLFTTRKLIVTVDYQVQLYGSRYVIELMCLAPDIFKCRICLHGVTSGIGSGL